MSVGLSAGKPTARLSVPGPRPVLGGLFNVARFVSDPVGRLSVLFRTYGPVVALAKGGGTRMVSPYPDCPGSVFVYGPELVRRVKTPHGSWEIPPLTGALFPLGEVGPRKAPLKTFSTGLWGVQGDEHRLHKHLLLPAFHRDRIAGYRDDMVAVTRSMLDRWEPGATFELHNEMLNLTGHIATKILFGEEVTDRRQGPQQTGERIWELVASPLTQLAPYDLPALPYRRFLNHVATFDRQMRDIISRKRAESGTEQGDVLSTLLASRDEENGERLTEDDLVGHVGALFGAAYETAASALTWTLFLISQHPSVAADLLDELQANLGGEPPTIDQLSGLTLLDHVVKESLRIFPPVPIQWRLAAEPMDIGGNVVPTGTEVYASVYHTHHMSEIYSDPESFKPGRWESLDPSTYEYVPFGAGPRRCIGDAFAMVEIKVVLSMLLQRYRLEGPARVRVDRAGFPVLRPKRGLPTIVHEQDRRFDRSASVVDGNVREMVALPRPAPGRVGPASPVGPPR